MDVAAILATPDGFVTRDLVALFDLREKIQLIAEPVFRHNETDVFSDNLRLAVAKQIFGSAVPTKYGAGQVFAEDGVGGGVDDRRQTRRAGVTSPALGDFGLQSGRAILHPLLQL